MWKISKEFHFSASHQLSDLPDDHQCARLHGHNYVLKITLGSSQLDNVGFIVDYGELGFVKDVVDRMDHRHLNNLFTFNPTSEKICRYLWNEFDAALHVSKFHQAVSYLSVSLSETPKTWAEYESTRCVG